MTDDANDQTKKNWLVPLSRSASVFNGLPLANLPTATSALERATRSGLFDRLTGSASALNNLAFGNLPAATSALEQATRSGLFDRLTGSASALNNLAFGNLPAATSALEQATRAGLFDRLTGSASALNNLAFGNLPAATSALEQATKAGLFDRLTSSASALNNLAFGNLPAATSALEQATRSGLFDRLTGSASALNNLAFGNLPAATSALEQATRSGLFDRLTGSASALNNLAFGNLPSATAALGRAPSPDLYRDIGRINALAQAAHRFYLDELAAPTNALEVLRQDYLTHYSSRELPPSISEHQSSPADIFIEAAPEYSSSERLEDVALTAFLELRAIETEVRATIGFAMAKVFGDEWFTSKVPPRLLKKWVRYRENALSNGEEDAPLLYYADFSDYSEVLAHDNNWETVFEAVFSDRDHVISALQRLNTLRRPTMHSRNISDELMRILRAEVSRLRQSLRRLSH